MDIPLPDDPPFNENVEESLADIPVPDDTNRYSPSLPIEDDPTDFKNDIACISLPSDPQKLPAFPTVSVLGKEAAKKRLLAFSQMKQSFVSQKRKSNHIFLEGNVLKDNETKSNQTKKKKKGVVDKARDTISEIEELKRRENEVMETMQVLFPMWSTLDKKSTPVTSLLIPDGIVERSDRIESVVEKLLSKKSKHERKEQERIERSEERKRKRERREKEIRRLMPKSWAEFNKSGFKAYHFRRQKFRLEKLSEGVKTKERTRLHEHEREGSKRLNLLDTPMVLKKPLVVTGKNNEDIEFPSWAVRHTNTWPSISYCVNPKYDTKRYISRKEMLSSLPDNIYSIIKKFLSSNSPNKYKEEKTEFNRSWWKRESFMISESLNNSIEPSNEIYNTIGNFDTVNEVNPPVTDSPFNELNDHIQENESERLDKNSNKSVSVSPIQSSKVHISDIDKRYNSEISETEVIAGSVCKPVSPCEENNMNDQNLASEYEQFIKTIGPNTDNEIIETAEGQVEEIWTKASEEQNSNSVSPVNSEHSREELENVKKINDKRSSKQKKKKLKKKIIKRSQSSDSSSSDTTSKSSSSSRSSSSSSRSSSTTSTSSSSSSTGSSSSSSSSSDSSSTSNDSSSESSSSSTSSATTSSSDSHSFQRKSRKLRRKSVPKKNIVLNKRNKDRKSSKPETDKVKSFIKKNKKNKDSLIKMTEELENKEVVDSSQQPFPEIIESNKDENGSCSIICGVEKRRQAQTYEASDYSPHSRTTDEDISNLSNSSVKSITSEQVLSNEPKDTNNSLRWNSAEDSVSNLPMKEGITNNNRDSLPEGKRHFNLDIFQESHNYTSDVSNNSHQSHLKENISSVSLSQNHFKNESKLEENDNNSISLINLGEESALKSLEKYSPTAEDEDEEDEEFFENNASVEGSTMDEASQLVSFGVNSASEEARMLDIPLPPPVEAPCGAPPTSFHNILQLPSSPTNYSSQVGIKKKNLVLIGKSPVARLTFGKQVMKLKPMSIFSTEDSDSEALPEKTPFPFTVSETNDASLQFSNDAVEIKNDHCIKDGAKTETAKIVNEGVNNETLIANIENNTNIDNKPVNTALDSSSPPSKKSRWDQEALKNKEKVCIADVLASSLLSSKVSVINSKLEKNENFEKKISDHQPDINVSEVYEKNKEKIRKEHSRSPISTEKKRRRERSHSLERDKRRRGRVRSPRDRGRFSRDRRRDFRKRSRSKDKRNRRDSPHHEYSPNWKKSSPQNKSSLRSPSDEGEHRKFFEKPQRTENIVSNHEMNNEPSTPFDSSWNKVETNLDEQNESYNSSTKKKEILSDWDSPDRKYSPPPRKESPKRRKSPRESPFRSPKNSPIKRKSPDHYRKKESPLRRRTPENRKESPNRRYSPRRSPLSWKRLSPDRRRLSPYSPRRSSPLRRRDTPDRKRPGSPYRRRLSPSPERKYSLRYSRKSPIKNRSYSISPTKEERWKWEEETSTEKATTDNEHFSKWDYEASQNDPISDYQTSIADSTISDSELVKEPASPKRMSLDERLKIELGHTNTNREPEQPQNIPAYHNFYYPPPTVPDRVSYYPTQQYASHKPSSSLMPEWNPSVQPPQLPNKLVQVGNVLQVVPTEIPVKPVFSAPPPKNKNSRSEEDNLVIRTLDSLQPKVLQVGNMLQVVPSQEPPPLPPPITSIQFNANNSTSPSPVAAPIPKLTAPSQSAQPVSIISLPFPPGSPNVFVKLEEKERRKKEKELRKQKKEQKAARRMLRKAMLKKRLAKANEAEVETNTGIVEVVQYDNNEIETSKTSVVLPSPDKGILISIKDTPVSVSLKRKTVSFADGVKPGEGTSPSGGEEHPLSPPPLIRKPVKKRRKRKVKVRIIRIDSSTKEVESEEDELSPPPPPPGTPPPEAYLDYTASGRYLYPVSNSQTFSVGNQDGGTVFPPLPSVAANPVPVVQFSTPPPSQQR